MTPTDLEAVRKRAIDIHISGVATLQEVAQAFVDRRDLLAHIDTPPDQATVEEVAKWLFDTALPPGVGIDDLDTCRRFATALLQRFPGLGSGWRKIDAFVAEDRATAIVACPSLNKLGEWLIGEAIYLCGDKPSDEGLWWWANTGPGDYFASPIVETNNAPSHFMPLPSPPTGEK